MFWSIIWLIWSTSKCMLWHAHSILSSIFDVFELIFCIFLFIYLFWHVYWLPIPFHHFLQFDYFLPNLTVRSKLQLHLFSPVKFDTITNGIMLVWLQSFLTELIVNGHHKYFKEYYWPIAFSFCPQKLLLLGLWHFSAAS